MVNGFWRLVRGRASDHLKRMTPPTAAAQLKSFLAKFAPAARAEMKAAHATMRKLLPGAVEMVYDNWNGLVIGFGPTERASEAVLSIVVLPDHVTLCFLQGKKLPDPQKLLRGEGNQVRHIRLSKPTDLNKRPIRNLSRSRPRRRGRRSTPAHATSS